MKVIITVEVSPVPRDVEAAFRELQKVLGEIISDREIRELYVNGTSRSLSFVADEGSPTWKTEVSFLP